MKPLLTLISILFFFSCDVTEPTIHGCFDSQACNYNAEATIDNNSCLYNIDCEGVCGGAKEEDSCGVCGGDNSTCLDCAGTPNGDTVTDCLGVCGGDAELDVCGICGGNAVSEDECFPVYDIDGNVYHTVQIGEQLWMAENLKVTHFNNGDEILTGLDNDTWISTEEGAYAVYDDDLVNANIYGNLYNWYAVDDERGICPEEWHVPSDDEFKTLEMFLGMSESEANDRGWRGSNEGSKLAGNADLWNSGVLENNPEYGTSSFELLPGGCRGYHGIGNYYHMGYDGYLWSSTEDSEGNNYAWYRTVYCNYLGANRGSPYRSYGFSVRCLKDEVTTGCTDPSAINYNSLANANDGSCYHDTVMDIDGNEYQAVKIGEQLWMKENLKTTHYRNGDAIQYVQSELSEPDVWENLSTGAYGYYNDDLSHQETYGNLYNWFAVDDSRGVCPDSWHVPSDDEFKTLEMFLGMSESEANDIGYRGTNEGSKLAGNADLWNSGNLENNSEFSTSIFNGFPAGYRNDGNGVYYTMGNDGCFWSSTGVDGVSAWRRWLDYGYSEVYRYYNRERNGFSVRCVKD